MVENRRKERTGEQEKGGKGKRKVDKENKIEGQGEEGNEKRRS